MNNKRWCASFIWYPMGHEELIPADNYDDAVEKAIERYCSLAKSIQNELRNEYESAEPYSDDYSVFIGICHCSVQYDKKEDYYEMSDVDEIIWLFDIVEM